MAISVLRKMDQRRSKFLDENNLCRVQLLFCMDIRLWSVINKWLQVTNSYQWPSIYVIVFRNVCYNYLCRGHSWLCQHFWKADVIVHLILHWPKPDVNAGVVFRIWQSVCHRLWYWFGSIMESSDMSFQGPDAMFLYYRWIFNIRQSHCIFSYEVSWKKKKKRKKRIKGKAFSSC